MFGFGKQTKAAEMINFSGNATDSENTNDPNRQGSKSNDEASQIINQQQEKINELTGQVQQLSGQLTQIMERQSVSPQPNQEKAPAGPQLQQLPELDEDGWSNMTAQEMEKRAEIKMQNMAKTLIHVVGQQLDTRFSEISKNLVDMRREQISDKTPDFNEWDAEMKEAANSGIFGDKASDMDVYKYVKALHPEKAKKLEEKYQKGQKPGTSTPFYYSSAPGQQKSPSELDIPNRNPKLTTEENLSEQMQALTQHHGASNIDDLIRKASGETTQVIEP